MAFIIIICMNTDVYTVITKPPEFFTKDFERKQFLDFTTATCG